MPALNYKHLHYFQTVAKTGSISKASEHLHVTPQTISGQLTHFESVIGAQLFKRAGRQLELNDMGRLVLSYADEIFALGDELEGVLRERPTGRPLQFRVGIADVVPKSLAYRLVEPAMRMRDPMRIICREGKLVDLLGDLAVHRLDLVIADSPLPPTLNVRGYSHQLGECGTAFFAAPALAARLTSAFPASLDNAPMLFPGELAVVRRRLMQWFEKLGIRPNVVGEFDDSALMKAFGQAGTGVFPAPTAIAREVQQQFGVVEIGRTDAVPEQFYAISVEHRLKHPAVLAISSAAREQLFHAVK